ncbi:hypothetical protein MMUC44124_22580 [Mycolicibacterium mucogenicum DSM 44124]|nr:hypothetical protein MMUC44124_22580 [Mycolicibacterium mucogenicum DSM 44124]
MPTVIAIGTYLPLTESSNAAGPLAGLGLDPELDGVGIRTLVKITGTQAGSHPPGAIGVAQCVELFQQLRGTAHSQVDGARIALAHNIGGPAAVSAVTILEGPGADGR